MTSSSIPMLGNRKMANREKPANGKSSRSCSNSRKGLGSEQASVPSSNIPSRFSEDSSTISLTGLKNSGNNAQENNVHVEPKCFTQWVHGKLKR